MSPRPSLAALFAEHDAAFIEAAYQALLGSACTQKLPILTSKRKK